MEDEAVTESPSAKENKYRSSWKRGSQRGPAESEAHHLLGSWLWAVQAWTTGNSGAHVICRKGLYPRKLEATDLDFLGARKLNLPWEGKRDFRLVSQRKHCWSSTGIN